MDQKLTKWIRWLKVVRGDIEQLLIKRHIFWEVQEMIDSNSELHKPSSFYSFLGDTYIAYVAIGIRRQVKVDNKSVSFARLLNEIETCPEILSREYYTGLYKDSHVEFFADRDFDRFCGRSRDHVSPKKVGFDLRKLKQASSKIEEFADRRIAHHDTRKPKGLPRFKDVDTCLDILDKLYVKYHLMFHAQTMGTLMPTYQYNWKAIFEVPWLAPVRE